jgi:signal transduction histidine kinase
VRRQILLTVAAATLLVLVAFVVPLAVLVRTSAADRATSEATLGVQPLAAVVGVVDTTTLALTVSQVGAALDLPVTVFLGDGTVLGAERPRTDAVELAATGRAFSADLDGSGREVLIPVAGRPDGTAVIRVEIPPDRLREGVAASWTVLAALAVALLALALLLADRLARSYLGPVHDLTATATRLGGGDLDARLQPAGPPEVAAAGHAVNRLGRRILALLHAERESVADLSHRLRTPVTALRLDADGLRDPQERERLVGDVAELSRVVDQVIAEARRPVREGMTASSDAAAVVAERAAFWRVLAEDTDRAVTLHVDPGPLPVRLPEADLADAVDALLGNVFAHTPDGTPFSVTLRAEPGGGARLVVTDAGSGLPGDDVLARGSSSAGSSGLGLDIVRRSAEASGGGVRVGPGPDGGAQVVVDLGPAEAG